MDLGAGPGHLAQQLVDRGCSVTLVDRLPPTQVPPRTGVLVRNLDADPLDLDLSRVDVILLLDVIEHLHEPERFLAALRRNLDHRPRTLVLTTPNVAFVIQRLMLLTGQFNYGKAGILDRTHTRLFTFRSLRRLLVDSGLRIRGIRGVPAPFPKAVGQNALGMGLLRLNQALIRLSPAMFSYQIFVEAETTPDVAYVLADSRQSAVPARLERPRPAAAARHGRKPTRGPRKKTR
jgi:SAM-dependent methyltransferase